ncbi:hypothetical protein NMY22_g16086 [Coprinellus aureogranulatus]|nr:hypothetical protein NMY22_g16086 [Coprinellus aureogranulatus]
MLPIGYPNRLPPSSPDPLVGSVFIPAGTHVPHAVPHLRICKGFSEGGPILRGRLKMLTLSVALAVASAIQSATATIRFGCSQLVTQRFDPLVTPGQISPHVHQIIGGNAFNITMDPNEDYSKTATCTTCRFKEDKSNYWTAVLYFKHANGSYLRVPQKPNDQVGNTNGGHTVYYIAGYPPFQKVTAFAKGFRMIAGDPMIRSKPAPQRNSTESYAISFRCWDNPRGNTNNAPPGGGQDTAALPTKFCAGGIRSNIIFPTCWDGKTLDPPDHASHMRYQIGTVDPGMGIIWQQGTCPSTHPVRTPTVIYEIVWDTAQFRDVWPKDGSQPLVMSQGDPAETDVGGHVELASDNTVTTSSDGKETRSSVLWITARTSSVPPKPAESSPSSPTLR